MGTKLCAACKETKPVAEFGFKSDTPDGLCIYCRPCKRAAAKAYRTKGYTKRATVEERFASSVVPVPETGCWLWDGRLNHDGYGFMSINKKYHSAHRLSWLKYRGEIPEGLSVLHKCDVRNCVNPEHLFLGTQQDNMADMMQKGRRNAYGKAKLTPESVAEIRRDYPAMSLKALAARHNVHHFTVRRVINREIWQHV